jgi:hypothetical protein
MNEGAVSEGTVVSLTENSGLGIGYGAQSSFSRFAEGVCERFGGSFLNIVVMEIWEFAEVDELGELGGEHATHGDGDDFVLRAVKNDDLGAFAGGEFAKPGGVIEAMPDKKAKR